VIYGTDIELNQMFARWRDSIIELLSTYSGETNELPGLIARYLQQAAIAIKHPGFREEQEWRVVFRPSEEPEGLIRPAVRAVNHSVQVVYEMPLEISDREANTPPGYSLDSLLDRLIVGPSIHPAQSVRAFAQSLQRAGVVDPMKRLTCSNIPLRV
jgi:hypothetical protein